MTFLEYVKKNHKLDVFIVLLDKAGYPDQEIMRLFKISKQTIYDVRKNMDPIIKAIEEI